MPKSKKNKNKGKLNLTVREEQRNKLEQMASLEKRSVSNLIEVMADERWERLVEQQDISYAQTIAGAMNLNSTRTIQQTARNCAEQFSILSPGGKCQSKKGVVETIALTSRAAELIWAQRVCDKGRVAPKKPMLPDSWTASVRISADAFFPLSPRARLRRVPRLRPRPPQESYR